MRYVLSLLLLVCIGCSKQEEESPLHDVDTFFKVYETFLEYNNQDSPRSREPTVLLDSALAQYNMTVEEFDSTLSYLESHPDEFLKHFEQLDNRIRRGPDASP